MPNAQGIGALPPLTTNDTMVNLAAYAASPELSAGRKHSEPPPSPYRNEFQRDRDRIIRSNAFRRLEYKAQILVDGEDEIFRTRLVHSLEVVQISRTVARALKLQEDLTEAIALAHDLGHPPFGHVGQESLNYCMKNYGGFQHNLQALRIVEDLEERFPDFRGLNLTYETREAILKQCLPKQSNLLNCLGIRYDGQTNPPTLEAQLVNLSDEIVYHADVIDDSLRAKLITIRQLREYQLFDEHYQTVLKKWASLSQKRIIYETLRRMIGQQITNVIETSRDHLDAVQPKNLNEIRMQEEPLINLSALMYEKHLEIKNFLQTHLYQHYRVRRAALLAHKVIRHLFETFNNDPYLLPLEAQLEIQRLQAQLGGDVGRARAVADYLAGLTDHSAMTEYEHLFYPSKLLNFR